MAELISGLKINYVKCELLGIKLDALYEFSLTNAFGCKVGKFPST